MSLVPLTHVHLSQKEVRKFATTFSGSPLDALSTCLVCYISNFPNSECWSIATSHNLTSYKIHTNRTRQMLLHMGVSLSTFVAITDCIFCNCM